MLLYFHYGNLSLSYTPLTSYLTSYINPLLYKSPIKGDLWWGLITGVLARLKELIQVYYLKQCPAYNKCSISVSYAFPNCICFAYLNSFYLPILKVS